MHERVRVVFRQASSGVLDATELKHNFKTELNYILEIEKNDGQFTIKILVNN